MPDPWPSKPVLNRASYDVGHLANFARIITCSDGVKRDVEFRFGYHCFTQGMQAHENTAPFRDASYPDELRKFCPERWYLSWRLVRFFTSVERERFIDAGGAQWVHNFAVNGIDAPYAIFVKFGFGAPGQPMIVNINSAYIKADSKRHGSDQRFDVLLTLTATTGRIPGR